MRTVAIIGMLVLLACPSIVHGQNEFPRIDRYELDVNFFPAEARMEGQATVYSSELEDIDGEAICYFHGELRVDSILVGGNRVDFDQDQVFYQYNYSLIATEVHLRPTAAQRTSPRGIEFYYSGYFHPSKTSSPSNYMRIDNDGVLLRSYGYSMWFPIFLASSQNDYPVSFSKVIIRTPADYRAVFVGNKIRERVDGGRRVSEWTAENVGFFDAQCTAQRYRVTKEGNYYLYHYDDSLSCAMANNILQFAATLNAKFNEHYRTGAEGGQYHIMEMPRYGEISSANVTGITAETWHAFETDVRRKRYLGHELVHPYVNVPVDRADPLWCLAIEGFPSYFHLPILAELLGDAWYDDFLQGIEKSYLDKRLTGKNRRGNPLPPEKPLLQIRAEEFSDYKDEFVLSDRALLFFNYLYRRNGKGKFLQFASELFNRTMLDTASFRELIHQHCDISDENLNLWLNSSDYPARFHVENFSQE